MKRQREPPSTPIILVDDDDEEDEFEPLFSYSQTVGPPPTFLSDDSDEEEAIITSTPGRGPKIKPVKEPSTPTPLVTAAKSVILDDDDSWLLASPPKLPKIPQASISTGNITLLQLRQKRRELMMLQEASSPRAILRVEELARLQAQRVESEVSPLVEPPRSEARASEEKEKVMIKVQNKSGSSQSIRIYTTDKFEKLFAVYAKMVETPLSTLSFRFDGDQLSPDSTPKNHDMEDGDVIEVYTNS